MTETGVWYLPDCQQADPFRLTADQREALARALLTHGVEEGLARFLARHGGEVNLAQAQEELLRIEKGSDELAVLELEHQQQLKGLVEQFRARAQELRRRQALLKTELEAFDPLAGALVQSQMLSQLVKPPRLSRWRRLLAWLARGWRALMAWLGRLRRRSPEARGPRRKLLPTSLVLGGRTVQVEVSLEQALRDPRMDLYLSRDDRSTLSPGKLRRWCQRNFTPTRYKEAARQALQREVDRVEARAKQEQRKKRRQLKKMVREEAELDMQLSDRQARQDQHHHHRVEDFNQHVLERSRAKLRRSITRQALIAGLVEDDGPRLVVSEGLIATLGTQLFEQLISELTVPGPLTGLSSEDTGTYQRRQLMSQYEISRLDLIASLLNARLNHPDHHHLLDSDLVVHAEERLAMVHVVICLDASGSMEEHGRLEAAKRAALALYGAVKAEREQNRVDFVVLATEPRQVGLRELWGLEARGFTNTAAAVQQAQLLLEEARADRRLVYLITDGLPEAYTAPSGRAVAGDLDRAMALAREALRELSMLERTRVGLLLLEPEDELFVTSARELALAGRGHLLITDPQALMRDLVVSFMADPAQPEARPQGAPAPHREGSLMENRAVTS